MTTIAEAMRDRAFVEFDQMAAEREQELRSTMKAAGCSSGEIESYIAECRARIAEERALIPGNVAIALMKAGVPLGVEADAWN